MTISDQINQDIKTAMKARDSKTLSALRDIKSKIMLESTKEGASGEVAEDVVMKILNKLYKQRMEAGSLYKEQGREDLYGEEMEQAEVIKTYLPQPLSEEEIKKVVDDIIAKTGASSMADMGKVMGMASKEMAGKADGKVISEMVKKSLNS